MRRFSASDPAGLLLQPRVLESTAQRLLIVWHSRTGMAQQMAEALHLGACNTMAEMGSNLIIDIRRARDTEAPPLK